MNALIFTRFNTVGANFKRIAVIFLLASMVALPGCISSTKVYTTDKTLVFGNNTYNLNNVQRLGTRIDGTVAGGEKIRMDQMGKSEINALLTEHSVIQVTTSIEMDDRGFNYQNVKVDSYSDFSKAKKKLNSAMSKINKFMANKKSRQLKLK